MQKRRYYTRFAFVLVSCFTSQYAFASGGCAQFRGYVSGTEDSRGSYEGTGFAADDVLAGQASGSAKIGLYDKNTGVQLVPNGKGFRYVVPAATNDTLQISGGNLDAFDTSWEESWACQASR